MVFYFCLIGFPTYVILILISDPSMSNFHDVLCTSYKYGELVCWAVRI